MWRHLAPPRAPAASDNEDCTFSFPSLHGLTHAHSSPVLIAPCACVHARPRVIPLRHKVPVPRTEEAFVFQSQPVETGGRWRGEGRKSRMRRRWGGAALPTDTIYMWKKIKNSQQRWDVRRDGQRAKSNNKKKLAARERRDAQRRRGDDKQRPLLPYDCFQDSIISYNTHTWARTFFILLF